MGKLIGSLLLMKLQYLKCASDSDDRCQAMNASPTYHVTSIHMSYLISLSPQGGYVFECVRLSACVHDSFKSNKQIS